jgi:hypothetical protein
MPHKYTKVASGRLFKNATEDENGNPRRGPSLSNSKVEIMEDLKAGDTVELAGWVNKNDDGEQTLTITVTKKEFIGDGQQQQQSRPAPKVTADDIPPF